MSALLIAILLCALYELKNSALKPAMLLNEYVTLTGRFFEEGDVGFVNGLLERVIRTL